MIDKGCVKRKSLILKQPKGVPEKFIFDFIRGYFDGDGCLTYYSFENNRRAYQIKIVSTEEFCRWLFDIFKVGNFYYDKRTKATWIYEVGGNK